MASSQFIAFSLFTVILPTLTMAAEHIVGSTGKKWYICGFGKHCSELGQKLVINVEGEAPAPTPIPNAAYGLAASGYQIIVAAVAVVAGMIVA
ncbi:hypothetical protein POTOM_045248 [Populus tomentosa]|uniref:Uncharacterized protein n=1 Tax=Populus tomentosa TaxID=118781 RepID=A0A8X8CCY3_POPTO|nr:hypothetical protein POTOM_045248 [Populus tomentosa]